ncbi:hypothetical protein J1N35_008582 [Gossypium stocksii]|uniref:Uncharacterized protein n=1 Tax=Gossypium stocksii TaxID=47602 RepID=A0A9D3W8F7_9ROSI|nr:hypothetical protein J1N35_008582 [Gossypium stocksii]
MKRIKELLWRSWVVKVQYTPRLNNKAADFMANMSRTAPLVKATLVWFEIHVVAVEYKASFKAWNWAKSSLFSALIKSVSLVEMT